VGVFNITFTRLKLTDAIMIILLSISSIFSLHVNTLYAMPVNGTGNATTQPPNKDNGTTSNTPSVLRLSPVPLKNANINNNSVSLPPPAEPSTNNKGDTNAATHDTGSNSGTHRTQHSTSFDNSNSNHHKDNNNSYDPAQKIINKIKEKLKVGDIPFP